MNRTSLTTPYGPVSLEILGLQHGVETSEGLAGPVWRLGAALHKGPEPGDRDFEAPRVPDQGLDPAMCGRADLKTFGCFVVDIFHGHHPVAHLVRM